MLGPAVFRIPPPRRGDFSAALTEAAVESTWYHPLRYGTVTAVVEAPMWGVPGVEDGRPAPDAPAVLRGVSRTLRRDTRLLDGILARVRPHVADQPDAGRLLAPVDDYLLICPGIADSWDPDVVSAGHPLPPLSAAHLTALRISGRRLVLRTAGLMRQLVVACGADPAGVLPELDRLIDAWCAEFHTRCGARWIPVSRQVEYQTRVVQTVFGLARRHARVPARTEDPMARPHPAEQPPRPRPVEPTPLLAGHPAEPDGARGAARPGEPEPRVARTIG